MCVYKYMMCIEIVRSVVDVAFVRRGIAVRGCVVVCDFVYWMECGV